MCRRVTCSSCGRPTFAGCGMHVEQVLADVPREKRCNCAAKKQAQPPSVGGFFSSLFGGSKGG